MEIFEKVKKYLYTNVGHLVAPGTPRFDHAQKIWKVPVLCKTERGIIIVGEFHVGEDGSFLNVPTREEMVRVVELEVEKLPFLFYGSKKQMTEERIKPVTI